MSWAFAHHRPLGLGLTFARHHPLRLRYRSPAPPWRECCSLREAASGCAPDRAVPFLCFAKEKEPKERRPDGGGRPRADCSAVLGVWDLAQNSLRGLRPMRSDNRAKSVDEACLRTRPQTPVLLDATHGAQEQYGRLLRKLSPSHLASHRARGEADAPSRRCEARRVWCLSPPSDELSSAGLCGARDSAHPELTSRRLSERSERSERSELGAAAKTEQRKAALAQRGPRRRGRFLCPLSLSTQRKGVGRRAETPARPHAVNNSFIARAAQPLDSRLRGNDGAA